LNVSENSFSVKLFEDFVGGMTLSLSRARMGRYGSRMERALMMCEEKG
jgi:hypothetical protein